MSQFGENLRGIIGVTACNFLFLINDTMIKVVHEELPLGQILFMRGLMATALMLPIVWWSGAHREARLLWNWPVFLRLVAEVLTAILFLIALFNMPISNATAILQVIPLTVTAAAAIFLGEQVGWKRWLAIAVGLCGVLIIIRPGFEGFNAFSLVALAAVVFITVRDMTTRFMPTALPALLVALATGICVATTGPVLSLAAGEMWVWPSTEAVALTVGAAAFLIGGYLTAVDFMRHGDISVIAPFRYSVIIWAIIVGFIVWGEVPDLYMLIGTVIVVLTGIYTFHRERRISRLVAESDIDM